MRHSGHSRHFLFQYLLLHFFMLDYVIIDFLIYFLLIQLLNSLKLINFLKVDCKQLPFFETWKEKVQGICNFNSKSSSTVIWKHFFPYEIFFYYLKSLCHLFFLLHMTSYMYLSKSPNVSRSKLSWKCDFCYLSNEYMVVYYRLFVK